MKIIFDFDDTVFDTKKFKEEVLFNVFDGIGKNVDKDVVREEYVLYRKEEKVFKVDVFLENIINKYNLKGFVSLEDLYKKIQVGVKKCVIPEYEEIIKRYGKKNIVILTHGDEKFQNFKIGLSGIADIVEEVTVMEDSKEQYIIDYCTKHKTEKVYFVDDKIENFLSENLPRNLIQVLVVTGKPVDIESFKGKISVIETPLDLARTFVVKEIRDRSEGQGLL